jgi:hypothetical protein
MEPFHSNGMTSPLLSKDDEQEDIYDTTTPPILAHPVLEDDYEQDYHQNNHKDSVLHGQERGKEKGIFQGTATASNKTTTEGVTSYVLTEEEDHDNHACLEESTTLLNNASRTVANDDQIWERGQVQPRKYRDLPFAIIFWIQFLSIAIYGIVILIVLLSGDGEHSPSSGTNHQGSESNGILPILSWLQEDMILLVYGSLLPLFISLCFVFAFSTMLTSQRVMERLIVASQVCIILSSILVAGILLYQGLYLVGFLAILSIACSIWYLIVIQNRIPFAAANLNCGLHAIRNNKGVLMVAMFHWVLFVTWFLLWFVSLSDAMGMEQICETKEEGGDNGSSCQVQVTRPGWIFPWVLSFFWTVQVVKYTVQTIVAGVSATWYFTPCEASSFCSSAVRSSVQRSWSSSFGSICFGALLVAVIQFLDWLVNLLRTRRRENGQHGDGGGGVEALLLCCLDCILSLMEDIIQYFNKWVSHACIFCLWHCSALDK